jgi:hypothetical protein
MCPYPAAKKLHKLSMFRARLTSIAGRKSMHRFRKLTLALALVFVGATWVQADDEADARAIIAKAIKASGDLEKYAGYQGATAKGKGTIHIMGMMIPFTMDARYQFPDKSRVEIDADIMGQQIKVINILNSSKGWAKLGDTVAEMNEDQLAEAKDQVYALIVTGLLGLKDKSFKLSTLGELKIEGADAVGVRVAHAGQRDISLWFDKKTGLLIRTQQRVKDGMTGTEHDEETFYSDYKDKDGVKAAMKIKVQRDGKPFLDAEMETFEAIEKQDDGLFGKP